jgi:dTDP-glucose 4,6-dehydratase
MKIVLTGATGFVGSRFYTEVLGHTTWDVFSLERLPSKLSSSHIQRLLSKTLYHDLRSGVPETIFKQVRDANYLVHFAGDVSGIKSLAHPVQTVETNVLSAFNTLELARKMPALEKFIYISSGEAVGSAKEGETLAEDAPLHPSNPYAASKAAGEALVNAYRVSLGVPGVVVRLMNVFGPGQSDDRFVPMVLKSLIEGREVVCHIDSKGRPGSRNWIHNDLVAKSLLGLIQECRISETYHLVGPQRTNREIINVLASALSLTPNVKEVVPGPSHDHRYALRNTKISWDFETGFEQTLVSTAHWYNKNR